MNDDLPTRTSLAAVADRYGDAETVYSVLSSRTWRGPWQPPETMRVFSVLGHIVLDYRDADLPPGVTAVDCEVYLASIELVVPDDVDVDLTGSVFLGSIETKDVEPHRRRSAAPAGADGEVEYERPLISVDCSGVMGSVEIKLA